MRTSIYIDGFNLYYGAVKDTPYKWLNLDMLCRLLLAQYHTMSIHLRRDTLGHQALSATT